MLGAHYFRNAYDSVHVVFLFEFVRSRERISIGQESKTILKGLKLVCKEEGTLHRQKPYQ